MATIQYTVKSGDNLSTIGANYGVNYKTAITGYDTSNPNLIKPGQVLSITTGAPAATAPATPVSGMTPAQIAAAQATLETAKKTLLGIASSQGIPASAVTPPPPATPSAVQNTDQAKAYINGNQSSDAASYSAPAGSTPEVRNSTKTYDQILADIKSAAGVPASGTPAAVPDKPNLEQSYKDLRTSYGVDGLEMNLTDLNSKASALLGQLDAMKVDERGKPVATGVIEGRISQEQQNVQEQLDVINRSIATATNQLNTKYNVINTLMKYKSDDYNTAKSNYDTAFSQNLQLINLAKGISDNQKTEDEQAKDDARANAQIVINTMTARGTTYSALPADEQTTLTKLGVQSGLGANFFKSVLNVSAGKEILTTITSADQTSATIIYKDGTTKNIATGLPPKPITDTQTTEEKQIQSFKNDAADLQLKMASRDVKWKDAWNNLHTKYPNASTELIDQTLGLDYRAKYDN